MNTLTTRIFKCVLPKSETRKWELMNSFTVHLIYFENFLGSVSVEQLQLCCSGNGSISPSTQSSTTPTEAATPPSRSSESCHWRTSVTTLPLPDVTGACLLGLFFFCLQSARDSLCVCHHRGGGDRPRAQRTNKGIHSSRLIPDRTQM